MKQLLLFLICSLSFATTVVLNGNTYTLKAHPRVWLDGPSGTLTTAMSNTGNRAQSSNPAYGALTTQVNSAVSTAVCSTGANTYSGYNCALAGYDYNDNFWKWTNAAELWFAQGANPADPNGYLAYAKAGLDHFEDAAGGSFACDETSANCNRFNEENFIYYNMDSVWTAYSLIRSQLSGPEIAAFVGKVLNDNDTSHNGFNSVACTKQTLSNGTGTITVTTASNVVTGSGTTFTSLAVGDVLYNTTGANSGQVIGVIYSITNNTQLILTIAAPSGVGGSGIGFRYATAWTAGDCGIMWFSKHYNGAWDPYWTANPTNFPTNYPSSGGAIYYGQLVGCALYNICAASDKFGILVGLALADDDARAGAVLTAAYNNWITWDVPAAETSFTPLNLGSSSGYTWAWQLIIGEAGLAVTQSVISPPSVSFAWWQNAPAYGTYGGLPGNLSQSACWGAPLAGAYNNFGSWFQAQMMGTFLYDGSTNQKNYYYYLRTMRSDYSSSGWLAGGGQYLAYIYPFYDYNATATAPATQFVYKDVDLTQAQCLTAYGGSNTACFTKNAYQDAISLSDLSSSSTLSWWRAGYNQTNLDHQNNPEQGAFSVYRKVNLLAGDTPTNCAAGDAPGSAGVSSTGFTDNMIDLNGTTYDSGTWAPILRWAGTDPTGDSSSRYAYSMIDLTQTYLGSGGAGPSAATRANRHIAHFKKSGAQDYIVTYDDILMPSALAVAPKAYMHYYLNGIAYGTAISYNASALTVSNTQTAAGAKLNSAFICTAGANTCALPVDNANGTYTGGNGYTYRAYMCPSSNGTSCDATKTTGEWIGVFQPINASTGSMPTLTQLTATNFRVVQISDSTTPKVVAFAEGGATDPPSTYTSASFTSTGFASTTGQYLVAGLTAGTYTATIGGTTACSSCTVNANDNTLYFEGFSGAVSVTASGTLASPTFSPVAGTYSSTQSVAISCPAGATGCYNNTGSPSAGTPGTCDGGSTTYTTPVSVPTTQTLYSLCTEAAYTNSSIASAAYTINSSTGSIAAPIFSTNSIFGRGIFATALPVAACGATYSHCATFTVPSQTSTLTNFPITITGDSHWAEVGSGGQVLNTTTQTVGAYSLTVPADFIIASDACITTVPFGWKFYDTTGGTNSVLYAQTTLSSSTSSVYYACWGASSVTTFQGNPTGVFSAYSGVWPLPNGTTLSPADWSGNGNTGTINSATAAAGLTDGAGSFSGANIDVGSAIHPVAVSYSAMVKAASFPNSYNAVIDRDGAQYTQLLVNSSGKLAVYVNASSNVDYDGSGTHTLSASTWYCVAFSYSSAAGLIGYVNGAVDGTAAANGALNTTAVDTQIGNDPANSRGWNGLIQDARIYPGALSAAWLAAECSNQTSPSSFYTKNVIQ